MQNNGQGESVSKGMLLTDEDRALLLKVSNLLEELIETFEVLEDEETMKSIKEAEEGWGDIGLKSRELLKRTFENSISR